MVPAPSLASDERELCFASTASAMGTGIFVPTHPTLSESIALCTIFLMIDDAVFDCA